MKWLKDFIYLIKFAPKALIVAYNAHKGQRDKGGNIYLFHPIRVALNCKTAKEKITALLHDTIEDSNITEKYLISKGFNEEIVIAVRSLTRGKGECYRDFIKRCKKNPIAKNVKIADLYDNMDLSRLKKVKPEDLIRNQKYEKALMSLSTGNI